MIGLCGGGLGSSPEDTRWARGGCDWYMCSVVCRVSGAWGCGMLVPGAPLFGVSVWFSHGDLVRGRG